MFHQKYFKINIVQNDTLDYFFNCFNKAKFVFMDTETSGLNVRCTGKDYVVGYTFSFEDEVSKEVFYVPVRHIFEGKYEEGDRFKFLTSKYLANFPDFMPEKFNGNFYNVDAYSFAQRLKPLLENGNRTYIAHNISYDLHTIANEGIDIVSFFAHNKIDDTQVMVHTCDETVEKNLESVTKQLFHVEKSHYSEVIKTVTKEEKLSQGLKANVNAGFPLVQIPVGGQYSAEDVWFMKQMYPMLIQGLKDDEQFEIYTNYRIPFLKVLWKMERRGIKVDIKQLDEMQKLAEEEADNFKYRMFQLIGVQFNPDSSQHLYEILFGYRKKLLSLNSQAQAQFEKESEGLTATQKTSLKNRFLGNYNCVYFKDSSNTDLISVNLGFKPVATTDGGKYGYEELKVPKTGSEELKKLLSQENTEQAHQFIKELMGYKKISKLISAFMVGLRENIYEDGKVHCSFNICGCLEGNTLIPTKEGIFPIKELGKDLTHNLPKPFKTQIVNRNLEWEDTKYVVKYENVPTVKLTTYLGMELEGSEIHPIICVENAVEDWKKLKDITTNDWVVIPYGYKKFAQTKVPLVYNSVTTKVLQGTLPTVLDEEVAEFLGIYYADGCLKDNNGSFSIIITNGNTDVINRVKYLSKKLFGREATVYKHTNSASMYISGKFLAPIESALELKRHCQDKLIPSIILKSPMEVVKAFIKGLTLDSCVVDTFDKTYLKFTLSNKISAKYLQELLLNIGIVSTVTQDTSKTQNVFHVKIYNKWYEKFCQEIGFIEQEKYKKAHYKGTRCNGYKVLSDKLYVKVKSLKWRTNDVYDFTVPKTHSFISMPCISHNTDSWRLSSQMPRHSWALKTL